MLATDAPNTQDHLHVRLPQTRATGGRMPIFWVRAQKRSRRASCSTGSATAAREGGIASGAPVSPVSPALAQEHAVDRLPRGRARRARRRAPRWIGGGHAQVGEHGEPEESNSTTGDHHRDTSRSWAVALCGGAMMFSSRPMGGGLPPNTVSPANTSQRARRLPDDCHCD